MSIISRLVKEPVGDQSRRGIFPFNESPELGHPHAEESIGSGIVLYLLAVLQLKLAGHRVVIGGIERIVEPEVNPRTHIQHFKPFTGIVKAVFGIDGRQPDEILRCLLQGNDIVQMEITHPEILFDDQLGNTDRDAGLLRQPFFLAHVGVGAFEDAAWVQQVGEDGEIVSTFWTRGN